MTRRYELLVTPTNAEKASQPLKWTLSCCTGFRFATRKESRKGMPGTTRDASTSVIGERVIRSIGQPRLRRNLSMSSISETYPCGVPSVQ